jgi:hypothetical protein
LYDYSEIGVLLIDKGVNIKRVIVFKCIFIHINYYTGKSWGFV